MLAEHKYHEFYKQSNNWSNVEILHALQQSTSLFIGMSMLDPNLRRLLDFVVADSDGKSRHYAILPLRSFNGCYAHKQNKLRRLQEDVYGNLGVSVIWYNSGEYAKVTEYLKSLLD